VITPVVGYALTRTEIAAGQIALFGYSLGGYLVTRAAAFEHRAHPRRRHPRLPRGLRQ
jgi:cephalosporin-C deacetylase-like acetyl esterase